MNIEQAISQLDPANDEHYTMDGDPRVDVVSEMVGKSVSRQEITAAAPMYSRAGAAAASSTDVPPPVEPAPVAPAPEPAPEPESETEAPVDDPPAPEPAPDPELDDGDMVDGMPKRTRRTAELQEGDSVLDLVPMGEIARSAELTERALREMEARIVTATRAKDQAEADLEKLYEWNDILTRHMDRMTRTNPNKLTSEVQAVLKRGQETRAVRTDRARRFIEAGTTAVDVAAELHTGCKLDQVMAQRKAGLGGRRSAPRPLMSKAQ